MRVYVASAWGNIIMLDILEQDLPYGLVVWASATMLCGLLERNLLPPSIPSAPFADKLILEVCFRELTVDCDGPHYAIHEISIEPSIILTAPSSPGDRRQFRLEHFPQ